MADLGTNFFDSQPIAQFGPSFHSTPVAGFLLRFLSFVSTQIFRNYFGVDVDNMEIGTVIGKEVGTDMVVNVVDCEMDEHTLNSDQNWMGETEHCMDMELVAYDAQYQTDSTKNLDGSAILNCKCWSMEVW